MTRSHAAHPVEDEPTGTPDAGGRVFGGRRRIAVALGAVLATGTAAFVGFVGVAPGAHADLTAPAATSAEATQDSERGDKVVVAVRQNHGQATQWNDCGPTSVVTSLLAVGVTPSEWDEAAPVNSIVHARADMGVPSGNTGTADLERAIGVYGVGTRVSQDMEEILLHVRNGQSVILGGNTRALPWPTNVIDQVNGTPHWITVADYDEATDEYLVADPISIENVVHRTDAATLAGYFALYPNVAVLVNV